MHLEKECEKERERGERKREREREQARNGKEERRGIVCAYKRADLAAKRNLRSVKIRPASERPDIVPRIILSQRDYNTCMCAPRPQQKDPCKIEPGSRRGAEQIGDSPRWDTWLRSPDAFLSLRGLVSSRAFGGCP